MYGDHQGALLWDEAQAHALVHLKENSMVPLLLKAYDEVSHEELEGLARCALCLIKNGFRLPGPLIALQISSRSSKKVKLEWVFANPGKRHPQGYTKETVLSDLHVRFDDNHLAIAELLYTSGRLPQTEVFEANIGVPARPAIIKRSHSGYLNFSIPIREALLQTRVRSKHVCKLLDINIHRGSKALFEVDLVMERMEAEALRRQMQNAAYTEIELRSILDCVADALLFAKLRVRIT